VGDNLSLSATPAGGTWSLVGTTNKATLSGSTLSANSAGTVTVRYTTSTGCYVDQQITLNGLPAVDAGSSQSVCAGGSVTLTATGASTYTWDNGVTQGQSFVPTVTKTYEVTGTDGNGCVNTDQVIVTVNEVPSITGSSTTVCEGLTLALTTSVSGGSWTSGNTGVATVNATTGVVTGVSSGTATITYTTAAGCTDTYAVTVNGSPVIGGTLSATVGGTSALSVSIDGSTVTGGTWSDNSSHISIDPSTGVVTAASSITGSSQTATVTYTHTTGCEATATFTVYAAPAVTSTVTDVCVGSSITLSATPSGGSWTGNDATVATVTSSGVVTGVAAGTVSATYTDAYGGTSSVSVTVHALPVYSTTAATAVCVGDNLSLSATPAGGTWSLVGTTNKATLSGSTLSANSAGTVTVRYTTSTGCYVDQQITLNGLPAVDAGSSQSVCAGGSVTLTATGASTYTWDNGVTQGQSFVPTVTKTYEVTGTDGNGCVNTDQVIVTVNEVPSITGSSTTVCEGLTLALTTSVSGGSWTSGNTGVATVNATTGVVTGVSSGTATITYTTAAGCTDTYAVTVNGSPVIGGTLSATVGGTSALSVSIDGSTVTGGTWSDNSSHISIDPSTGVVTAASSITGSSQTATVTYTHTTGCEATATFTVYAAPAVTSTVTDVCVGSSITLSATPSGGSWTGNDATVATVTSSGVVTGVAAGTVSATYTDAYGGTSSVSVTVHALPVYSTTAATAVCVGDNLSLSATPAGGTWSLVGTTNKATLSGSTLSANSAGTVTVRYTTSTGCYVDQQITLNGLPAVDAGSSQSVCAGGSVTLTATGASTYTWDNGVTQGQSFVPTVTKTYEVTGTDGNGCVNTDQVIVTVNEVPSITGSSTTVCEGLTLALTTSVSGGSWTSGNTGVATVNATTGVVTGVSSGTATITYTTAAGCTDTYAVTVNGSPVIGGTLSATVGGTSALSVSIDGSTVTGGTWSDNSSHISIDPSTGVVTAASSITGSSQTATVTYTHTTGCEATATFTVYAAPTITGPNGQVTNFDLCVGESLQLTGSGTPATTSPWVSNDASVSINSSTGEITANSAGSATITYTDINGGTSNITVNSYAIPVSPVIEHSSVSTAMHTICDGNETIMQVDGVIPYNINYVWEYSTTSAFASSSTVTLGNTIGSFVEEGVEGFYRAKAVSSVTNCSSGYSNILEIQTYSLSNAPSLAFSGSFNGSSTAIICDGQTVSLQASRNNGLATTQLVWEYRQTTTGVWDTIQQGINTSFTASQTGYYRVVEYSSGCSISSPYPPQSELYVNAISTSTVTLAMNGTPEYCVGDLLTFGTTGGYDYHSLNGQTPANGFTREWYIEKNNVATKITGNSYQVALSDNGSEIYFTDTYYDNAGNALCSSTTANPETITVNSLPTAPVVIFNDATNGVKTICDASSLTLKLNGNVTSIGNNTLNWEYSPDGNWNSSTTTSAPYISKTTTTIVVDSAGYYRAWFVNENNCNSVSSNVLEIQKVSLSSAPSLTITGTTSLLDTICSGGSATITATSTSASGITGSNFIWERSDDNGNSWATLSETSNSLSTGLEGWYRVTETNTSCSGQSATNNLGPTSNPFVGNTAAYINVVSPPAISLTAPSTGLDFCEGEVLTFTNNSSTFSATPKASGFTRTWYLQEQGAASPTQITTNTLVLTSNHDDAYLYIKDEHPAGCSITSSTTGIQISVKSAPSSVSIEFTDFTSSSATICSGTSTNIEVVNGSNLYTNNNATFIWEFDTDPSFATPTVNGNEFVATSNAWIKTIDEPGYYRVWIEQNGCQSLLASDDLELDTFNLPSPLITSNSPICDNSPIILTAASTYTGTLAVSFDWYKKQDDGSFSLFRTTSADTIHIYPSNSVYADESNFAVGISTTTNSGCSPSSISTPTLVDIEIPSSFTISTSKQYYCDEEYAIGSYFAASNNSINAPTDYTRTWEYYNPKTNQWAPLDLTGQGTQWLLSDLSNNTNTNVDIDIRAKDTYSGTGNLGCSTTSNTITVTVRPKPTPPVLTFSDGTNGAKTICVVSNTPVDPIGALATTTSVSGISQLIWEYSPDNTWGALTNAQASMVSALNASAANFSLDIGLLPGYYRAKSISSSTGCISTVSNTLQVLHETMSAPTITASATQVCQGTSVTLTAASTHSQAASFTYYWYKGSDTSAFTTSTTPSITISETGALSNVYSTGSFRVKTSLVGCGVSPKSGPQAITIIQPATLTVVPSSGITTFCEGDNITFGEPSSGENFEVSRVGQPANQLSTPTWWYIKDLPNATHTQISGNAISAITSDFDGAIIYVKDTYTGLSCSTTSPYNGVNAVTIAVNDAPLAPSITLAGNLASVTTECLADGIEILVTK
jgi:uncharacterized protein YjdB